MTAATASSRTVPGGVLAPPPPDLHLETARELDCGSVNHSRQFVVRYGESRLVQLSETAFWLLTVARDKLPVDEAAVNLAARTGITTNGADIHRYYRTVIARLDAASAIAPRPRGFVRLIPAGWVQVIIAPGVPLFRPRAVIAVVAVSLTIIALAFAHGLRITHHGGLFAAYALSLLALVIHELGHAAATAYHGARPGEVRGAIGPAGPRLHTDITDAWRLPKSGRVEVDLGGVYLQTVVAAGYGVAYFGTGWPVMATAMVLTVTWAAISLAPIRNSDGAWVVADLTGSRGPGNHPGPGTRLGSLSRAGRRLVAARWLGITALAGWLLAGGWRVAGELCSAAGRLWSGDGSGALTVVAMVLTVEIAGSLGWELVRQLRSAARWAQNRGVRAEQASSCPPGERLLPPARLPPVALLRPSSAERPSAPSTADTVATRVGEVLECFLKEKVSALTEVDADLAEMAAPLVQMLLAGGKRMRPLFCYWGWRGAGRPDCPEIVAAAAAFELLHGGALVHDDVMDGSSTRRGLPAMHRYFTTLHSQRGWHGDAAGFGAATAILLGDLCLSWSDELVDSSALDEVGLARARRLLYQTRTELVAGQYLDIQSRASGCTELRRARQVMKYKTSKYTIERPLQVGGTLAGASPSLLNAYSAYALPLGEAFQLRDDILGIFGDPAQTGKPVGEDLREGKRTALICHAIARADSAQRTAIQALLGRADLDPAGTGRLREIIVETGALSEVEAMISGRLAEALEALNQAPQDDPLFHEALRSLAVRSTQRES
jgi:geranylgeranyl diphosphate synthase type I